MYVPDILEYTYVAVDYTKKNIMIIYSQPYWRNGLNPRTMGQIGLEK